MFPNWDLVGETTWIGELDWYNILKEMGRECQKVQTSNYNIDKSWGCNV